jgi:hypothetical protein
MWRALIGDQEILLPQQMGGANYKMARAAKRLLLLLQLVVVTYVQAEKSTPSLGEMKE